MSAAKMKRVLRYRVSRVGLERCSNCVFSTAAVGDLGRKNYFCLKMAGYVGGRINEGRVSKHGACNFWQKGEER